MSARRLLTVLAVVGLLSIAVAPVASAERLCAIECNFGNCSPCICDALGGIIAECYECSDNDYACNAFAPSNPVDKAEAELFGQVAEAPEACEEMAEVAEEPALLALFD